MNLLNNNNDLTQKSATVRLFGIYAKGVKVEATVHGIQCSSYVKIRLKMVSLRCQQHVILAGNECTARILPPGIVLGTVSAFQAHFWPVVHGEDHKVYFQ